MKVLCVFDNFHNLNDVSTIERLKKYIYLSDGQLNVKKNKEYNVYGIEFRDNSPWYYINLDEEDFSPTAYPAEIFHVTNPKLSSYWRLSSVMNSDKIKMSALLFEEWANDISLYERFIDEDPEAIAVFKKYKKLMDEE